MTELKLVRNAAGWLRRFAIAISVLMFSLAVAISNFGLAQSTDTGANSVIDYSLTFNEGRSDQVAEHPDGNFILGQTNVTWEAWIYQTSRNVAGTVRAGIFSKEMNFVLGTDSGRLWSAFQTGGNVWNDNIYTRAVVPLNTWTHVAFVKAGTTMRVFMNGQLVEERANAAPQTINGNEYLNSGSPYRFSIGRRHNGEAFVGRIDEVRVWESVVRTEAQIAANMHTKVVAGNASGLVGYWDFNEPPGTQLAYDRNTGGYTQNLSLVNSPTRTDVKTVSSNNLDTVITFPRTYLPGVGGWTVPQNITNVQAFLAGGGGGGGGGGYRAGSFGGGGGGGAAGRVAILADLSLTSGSTRSVQVGQGGLGGGPSNFVYWEGLNGSNGQSSAFGTSQVLGGVGAWGAGKTSNANRTEFNLGRPYNDGAGGEGGSNTNFAGGLGWVNLANQNDSQGPGGGGAGSTANGSSATSTTPGSGGAGTAFFGATYAVGGPGGLQGTSSQRPAASIASANTGNGGEGGAGAGWNGANIEGRSGANGAAGVVIVRYKSLLDQALSLPGSSTAFLNGSRPTIPSGQFTVETWAYLNSNSGVTFFSEGVGHPSSNVYLATLGDGTFYTRWGTTERSTGITAPMGRWFHVALIRGSDNRPTLFLDGTSVWTDATANSSAPDSGGPFRVGIQTGNTSPLNGQLDNVKVWTGALTSAQIQASMHSYGATQSSGVAVASGVTLRAHYDFNEFNQGVEPDRSGNGFDLVASAGISSASYTDSLLIESGTAHALQTFVKFNRTYLTATGGWTPPSNVNRFKALVVGGGGAGGTRHAGGGGAGALLWTQSMTISQVTPVIVGSGALGHATLSMAVGRNGQSSFLGSMELKGGGGGAGGSQVASAGGSGGGANSNNSYQAAAGSGLGLANAGGNGATNNVHWWGGGGGGAMSAGGAASSTDNLSNPGSGGAGFVTNITGVNRCFAAGGGGGRTWIASSVGGTGGPCTSGQVNATVSTTGGAGSPDNIVAGSGQVNSGSGGGGGGLVQSGELWGNSGSGGSGVVILSYGPYLQVTRSPVAARVGSSFTNSIQVQLTNLDGSLFSSNSPVTVTSSAALILNGVPLTQSLTVNAVNGIATFAGLGFASSVTSAQTLTFTSDAFVGTSVTITPTFFANNLVINSSNSSTGFMLGGEFYASSSAGVSFLNVADLHANAVANTISISVSGSISISSAVNISISGRSVTFRAGADIHVANVNVLTQGPLNFFSDADGSGSGSFNSDTSSLVNSQGGRVVISGGLDPTTGYAVGSSNSQWSGARILGDLWSGGGDIIIRGDSGAGINTAEVTAPNWTAGVLLGAKTVDAGSGAISISGAVNRNADNTEIHYGVSIGTNDATVNGVVRTTTGGISIRVDSSPTTGANKEGFGLMRADVLSDTGVITISAVASATANEIDVNTSRNSRISTSGSITVEGRGPGTEYLGSLVLSSPNAIVIRGDRPDINSGFVFTSSPVVTLESFGASFSATVATTNLTVGSATRGLRIGKTTNTSAVTLGSSMTVNGPIEVYGSDISLTNKPSLVVSSQSARLLLRATRNIDVAAGTATNDRSLLQTNMGDLILWVNSTNGGSGYLYLGNFAVLNSANGLESKTGSGGGRITLAGGSATDSAGHPTGGIPGFSQVGNYEGLWVAPSVKIYSGGGDVYIAVAHTIAGYQAAAFRASSLIWSGTGRITASVSHTATSGTSRGIELADTTWVSAATSSPAISITARVSNGSHAIYQSSGESFTLTSLASAGGGISVSAFTPVTTNTALFWYGFDVLSRTGEISVFSNGVSNWNSTQARDFGAATGTDVLSSSATISIQVEDFLDATANNQSAISTSSRVQIRPNGSNFASTDTQLYFRIDAGSVILGNSSNLNSSTVTWNSRRGIRSNGPIEIYGNRFALREQSDLQTTGLAARVLVRLKDGMYVDAGSSDSDAGQSRIWTNRGDLILWADTDGDGSGGIVMESFTDLNTANGVESTSSSSLGGRILLGGGSSVGADGYPTGNAGTATWGYTNRSIHTGQNVDIYSGGGDIRILGRSNSSYGVVMYFGTDIVSGVGTVELRAETTGSGTGFYLDEAVNNVPFNIISYASSSPAISFSGIAASSGDGLRLWGSSSNQFINLISPSSVGGGITLNGVTGGTRVNVFQRLRLLSAAGEIRVNGGAKQTYFDGSGTSNIFGADPSSPYVSTSSASVTFTSDTFEFSVANTSYNTSGELMFLPHSNNFFSADQVFGQKVIGTGGLTIGRQPLSGDTHRLVYVRESQSVSGEVKIYGGDIIIGDSNYAVQITGSSTVSLIARSNIRIEYDQISSIQGNIHLQARSTSGVEGGILAIGSTFNTFGGRFLASGGSNPLTDFAIGTAERTEYLGVAIYSGSGVYTRGGDLIIRGSQGPDNDPDDGVGTYLDNSVFSSGNGDIQIYGRLADQPFTSGTAEHSGILTYGAQITSTGGDIEILGDASAITGGKGDKRGILFWPVTVTSQTGNISISGTLASVGTDSFDLQVVTASTIRSRTGFVEFKAPGAGEMQTTQLTVDSDRTILIEDDLPNINTSILTGSAVATVQPTTNSFQAAFNPAGFTFNPLLSGLTIGKSTSTAGLTINQATTINGPVNVLGGAVTISANITSTTTSAFIRIKANTIGMSAVLSATRSGRIIIANQTPSRPIHFRGTQAGVLILPSNLNTFVSATTLQVGDSTSGDITVNSGELTLTSASITNLLLVTPGSVVSAAGATITAPNLAIDAGGGVNLPGSNSVSGAVAISASSMVTYSSAVSYSAATVDNVLPVFGIGRAISQTNSPSVQDANEFLAVTFNPPPQVAITDAYNKVLDGNNRTAYTYTVSAAVASGSGVVQGLTSSSRVGGLVTFNALRVNSGVGIYAFTFSAEVSPTSTLTTRSIDYNVMAGEPGQLVVTANTTSAVVGQTGLHFSVLVRDAFGNAITAGEHKNITVSASVSGATILSGTQTRSSDAGVATFNSLVLAGSTSNTITVSFFVTYNRLSDGQSTTVTSSGTLVTLRPGAPTQLVIDSASQTQANRSTLSQLVVRMLDVYGNQTLNQTGTISAVIGSGSGAALIGASASPIATGSNTAAVATFSNIALQGTVGTFRLDFNSSIAGVTSVSHTVTLTPGAATRIALDTLAAGARAGIVFTQQPRLSLRDADDNVVSVSASISATSATPLSGTTQIAISDGFATYSDLVLSANASAKTLSYRVTAPAGYTSFSISQTILLTAGLPTQLVWNSAFSNQIAGTDQAAARTVLLRDAWNNLTSQSSSISITLQRVSSTDSEQVIATTGVITISPSATSVSATFPQVRVSTVGTFKFKASATGLTAALSNDFTITNASPSKLAILQDMPSSVGSGLTFSPPVRVQVLDQFNNPVVDRALSLSASVISGSAISVAGANADLVSGSSIVEFPDLAIEAVASNLQLRFGVVGAHSAASRSSSVFAITYGAPARLSVSSTAISVANRTTLPQLQVSVLDSAGNLVSNSTANVNAAVSGLTLGGTNSVFASSGVASFNALSLSGTVGTYSLSFTATSVTGATTSVTLTHGVATSISLTVSASAKNAQNFANQPVVRIFDADNNLVTTGAQSTQTVELIASSGSLGGSTAISASGGIATFSGVSLTGTAGSITLTGRVYQPQTLSANQIIELGFGNATKLTLETQAVGAASGIALTTQPVLRLRDSADNIVTGVAHNVVASIDPAASLSGATVAVNTSTGTATFTALSISGTVGSYTLSYSIEGASSSAVASVSQAIELTHGVAVALKMVSQPNSGIAGTTLSPMVIEMVDARGNRVTTGEASSRSVTITAVNFGLLRGTISASLSSGVVTFDNVSVTEAGSNIRFTIVAANLGTFLYSSNMNITAGAPTRLTVALGQPVNKKAGEAQAANLTVRLEDNFGNIGTASSTYSLTVQIVSSSDTSVVERTANALTISPGGTIADALKNNLFVNKVGSWRIKVSSAGLQPAITNAFSISNAAASKLVVIQDVPASARSGLTFSPAVKLQVQDQFNNPVLDSVTTISATVISGTSISVAGSRSANVLGDSFIELPNLAVEGLAGTKKLRFSMVANSANASVAFADSADFSLTFGVATRLSASATAVTVSNRTNFPSVTISVLDSAGNIVTDNQAQIIASASGLAATGTQNRFAASGQAVFDDLIFSGSVGNYSLGFSAASLTSATVSVTINHGSAYRVELKIQQSSRNNKTLNATGVYIYDRDDNLVTTGAQSTQTVVIEAAGAVLSGTSAISASAGIATFSNLVLTGSVSPNISVSAKILLPNLISTTSSFELLPGDPDRLAITTNAGGFANREVFGTAPAITVRDISGNTVPATGMDIRVTVATASISGSVTSSAATGVATFANNLSIRGMAGNHTLVFTAEGTSSSGVVSASQAIVLNHGAASQLAITQAAGNARINQNFGTQPAVELRDPEGNRVSTSNLATATIEVTYSGQIWDAPTKTGVTLLGTRSISLSAGVGQFANLEFEGVAGTYTLSYTVVDAPSISRSGSVTVDAGTPTGINILVQPQNIIAGQAFATTLQAEVIDDFYNRVTRVTSSATLKVSLMSSSATPSVISESAEFQVNSGLVNFTGLTFTSAGTRYLKFESGASSSLPSLQAQTSTNFVITHAAPSALVWEAQPATSVANDAVIAGQGEAYPRLRANDQFGNLASSAVMTVSASVTPTPQVLRNQTVSFVGGYATFTNLSMRAVTGSYAISFSATANSSAFSSIAHQIQVVHGTPDYLEPITHPTQVRAGVLFATQPVIEVRDSAGNRVENSSITVTVAAQGAQLTGQTSVAAQNGLATFTAMELSGSVSSIVTLSYTATFGGQSIGVGTRTVTLVPGLADRMTLDWSAADIQTRAAITPAPQVKLFDEFGNLVTLDNSTQVVAKLYRLGSEVTTSTQVFTASSGVITFTGLKFTAIPNQGYSLRFESTGLAAVSSSAIAVLPGPVERVEIVDQPGSGSGATQARTGDALPSQPRVKLVDFDGNIVTTVNSGSITAQIASGLDGQVLSASASISAGIAQFSDLGLIGRVATPTQSAEIYTLNFKYQNITSSPSAQLTLKHNLANKIVQIQNAVGGAAGLALSTPPRVKVVDRFGNTVFQDSAITLVAVPEVATGAMGSVINVSGNIVQTGADGAATFSMTLGGLASNTYRLVFKDIDETLIPASQSGIVLTHGQANQLVIARAASATDSNQVRTKTGEALKVQPVIEIHDAFGNRVLDANYTITASLSSTVRGARDYLRNFTASAVAGVATFSNLAMIVQPEASYQLTYRFVLSATALTQQSPLWVTHANAEYITIERQPQGGNKTGNSLSLSPVVTVRDFDGNPTTMISAETISAVIAQGAGSVTANGQASVVNGVATFSNLTLVALPGEAQRLRFELVGFSNSASQVVKSVASDQITLTFSDAHQLAVIQQPSANAITAELLATQPKVVVQDRFGNTVSDYVGNVWVESQVGSRLVDAQDQTLASISALVVNGVATFNSVRIEAPANSGYTLNFASGALATTTSNAVQLTHTSPNTLQIVSQPVGAITGQTLANQPQVRILDRFGNLADTNNSSQISVSVFSGPVRPGGQQAQISGSTTVTVTGGVATFSGLKFTGRVGSDYIWQFSDGARTVNSNPVRVSAAGAYSFAWVQLPVVDRTGELMTTPAALRALDFDGNLAVSSSDTVTVTVTGGGYIESGTTSQIVNGYVTFSNLILVATPGVAQQLTFTANPGNQSFAISTLQNLIVRHTTTSELRVNQSPTVLGQQGASFGTQPKIFLYDRYGNKAINDSSTVVAATIASGAGGAVTGSAIVTAVNGEANFATLGITGSPGVAYTLNYAANQGFSVTDATALRVFKTAAINVAYPTVNFSLSATVAPTVATTDSTEKPLVFTSTTTQFCTVNSATGVATIVSAGTCVIRVSIDTGTYYLQNVLDVNLVINKALQTPLLMTNPNFVAYGQILTLTHSGGSSTEAPSYYATGTCRAFGNQLMMTGDATEGSTASCVVRVIQDGDQNFESALSPAQRIEVRRISQQPLRIGNARETSVGDVELFTVGGSGQGTVSYRVEVGQGTATCLIVDGNKLRATTNGWCEVTAQKAMSTNYNTASSPVAVFTFSKQVQVVTFTSATPGMLLPGQSYQLAATASSGLSISYAVTRGLEIQASQNTNYSPAVCSLSGTTVTLLGTGTCEITATQGGNAQFAQASAKLILTVGQLNQVIEFNTPSDISFGSPATRLIANASSGLPVSYTVSSGVTACSVSSTGMLSLISAGDCTVVATQAGDSRYAPAAPVTRTFKVLPDRASAPALISAAVGNQWFTVGYTQPSYAGGSAIIGYRLEVTDVESGDAYVNSACSTTAPLSCTMVGLPNDRNYTARIAAITAAGVGRYSPSTANMMPTSAQISVTQLKANVSGADLVMNWTPPAVVSGNFVRYEVYVWPTGTAVPTSPTTTLSSQSANTVAVDVTSMSSTISQIANRTQPVFVSAFQTRPRVVVFGAVNQGPLGFIRLASSQSQAVASSQTGYEIRVVTITDEHSTSQTINTAMGVKLGLGAPSAPTQLTLDTTDPTKIIASWGAPDFDGGYPVLDYELRSNGQVICANITTRMCEISPLLQSTTYRIEVRARNSIGFGTAASSQHTTPTPPRPVLLGGGSELVIKTPAITSYSTRVIPLQGATVRVEGVRLRGVDAMLLNGKAISFSFITDSQLMIELPANPAGTYDLLMLGTNGRVTIVDAFTYAPEPERLKSIRGFVDGFLGQSTTLGRLNTSRIQALFDKVPGADTVRCIGSIPTKAKLSEIRLAKKRADRVCAFVEKKYPGVEVSRSWVWRDGESEFKRGQVRLVLTTERLEGGI